MSDRMTGPGLSMLVYLSSATDRFDEGRIPDLLAQSREKNGELDVTGLLLYEEGRILQVLEGEAETVEKLFDTIRNDRRHSGCIVVLREPIAERKFPDWSMGFRQRLPVPNEHVDGVIDYFRERIEGGRTSSQRIGILLDTFRDVVDIP